MKNIQLSASYRKLSLIIPVYNESKTLRKLINKVLAVKWPLEIELVCVNDASKDNSLQILQGFHKDRRIKILSNEQNMGKSQSVRRGILASTGDLVVIQDADLEYEPADLLAFLELYKTDSADVVYGNRFGRNNKVVYWSNWFGNRLLSGMSSVFTLLRGGFTTKDMEVCYKMVRGEVYREVASKLVSRSSFGFEPELTARLAGYRLEGRKLRFKQLPINYYPRTMAQGKHMKGMSDGLKAVKEIFRFNLWEK